MKSAPASRIASTAFLAFAASLAAYGLYGLSGSTAYTGEYHDSRLIGFDNGVYPFLWGCLLLLLGQCLRLRRRLVFMGATAVTGLLVLAWKRVSIPALENAAEKLFPDAGILDDLIVVCAVMLGLMLADRFFQRLIDFARHRPSRKETPE